MVGEGPNAQVDAREVEALAGPELSPDENPALDVLPLNLEDFELDITVIEKNGVSRFYGLGEAGEGDRNFWESP
jgi:hypothetical protein